MASTPVAIGSSVPACPAFCASKMRRTWPTTCVEVTPFGLSTITQPWTGEPFFLRLIVVFGGIRQIAAHALGLEKILDLLRFRERFVFDESEVGRELELDHMPQLAADEGAMTVERG